jgi:hypothetical protein
MVFRIVPPHSWRRAFSIPEMLVRFVLFSVVITIFATAFVDITRTTRLFVSYLAAQSNLRYTTEFITREVKEGYGYTVGSGMLGFYNKDGQVISYAVVTDADAGTSVLMRTAGGATLPMTDPALKVVYFNVFDASKDINQCPPPQACQPRLTFSIKIEPLKGASAFSALPFILQSSVTQRRIIPQ